MGGDNVIEEAHRETIIAQAVGDFFAYGNDPETWASFVQKYAEQLGEPAESIDADIRGRIVRAFLNKGHHMVDLDLAVFDAGNHAVAAIKHTAIVRLRQAEGE